LLDMNDIKGSYILGVMINKPTTITIGALGTMTFGRGHYLYCGSALGGILKRVKRYFKTTDKRYWHIDYLLSCGSVSFIDVFPSGARLECILAELLCNIATPVRGFGSSDCSCLSHLFRSNYRDLSKVREDLCLKVMRDSGILNIFSLFC